LLVQKVSLRAFHQVTDLNGAGVMVIKQAFAGLNVVVETQLQVWQAEPLKSAVEAFLAG
jgi:hypothetical protein